MRALDAARLWFDASRGGAVLALCLAVVDGLLAPAAAWCTKLLLDELALGPQASETRVAAAAAGLAAAGLVAGGQRGLADYVNGILSRAVQLTATDRLMRRVNGFPSVAPFENPAFLDRLRLAAESGTQTPQQVVEATLALVRGAAGTTGFVVALAVVWPPMIVVVVAAAVPAALLYRAVGRRQAALTADLTPLTRRQIAFQSLLTDIRAAKEIRLFALGTFLRERLVGDIRAANDATTAVDRRMLRVTLILELLGMVGTVAGVVTAAYLAMRGRISVGDVSVYLAAVAGIHACVMSVSAACASGYAGLLLYGSFRDLAVAGADVPAAGPPARPDPEPVRSVPALREGIEFRNVSFRYGPSSPWVLRDCTFRIETGRSTGLVGLNGAGKSTLIKLLCVMYRPQRGEIRWDGIDLRDLNPAELRARIGAVFQDFMEYDLTAAENIAVGRLALIDDRRAIQDAARASDVDSDLRSLPRGYDTLLSRLFLPGHSDDDPAAELSGGQWQRVALARAILRADADLLILDEPSSGLDAAAEHTVHERLRSLRVGRTSLLISHRLNTIRNADTIAVLDGGQIVEQGSHDELMVRGGRYARLFDLQASGYRERAGA